MKQWIKKNKKGVVVIAVVLVLGITAAIVLPKVISQNEETMVKQKTENVISLSRMNLTSSVSATGTVESANSQIVRADVTNVPVKKVKVKVGDSVKKGQTLVTFDQSDLEEAYGDAKDTFSDTQTQNANSLSSAKRKLTDARETYSSEKIKLQNTVNQAKKKYLSAKEKVAKAKNAQEKEKEEEALQQAKSSYEQAKEEQSKTNKQNKESIQNAQENVMSTENTNKRSLKEAKRSVSEAEKALKKCSVTASMDGIITAVGVEEGEICNGGELFEISDCLNYQVSTTVSEYDVSKVKKGQKVIILTDATGDTELQGEITYVALTTGGSLNSSSNSSSQSGNSMENAGSSSSSSSEYEVVIKMKDTNEKLRVGMTAKCSIVLEEVQDVYAVPYDAIHTNKRGESVLFVKDGENKKSIAVTKGMESDYYVEVQGENLEDNMQIVIPTDEATEDTSKKEDSDKLTDKVWGENRGQNQFKDSGNRNEMGAPEGAPAMRGGFQ